MTWLVKVAFDPTIRVTESWRKTLVLRQGVHGRLTARHLHGGGDAQVGQARLCRKVPVPGMGADALGVLTWLTGARLPDTCNWLKFEELTFSTSTGKVKVSSTVGSAVCTSHVAVNGAPGRRQKLIGAAGKRLTPIPAHHRRHSSRPEYSCALRPSLGNTGAYTRTAAGTLLSEMCSRVLPVSERRRLRSPEIAWVWRFVPRPTADSGAVP